MELSDEALEAFFSFVSPHLDEKQRRMVAGGLAAALGRGGTTVVAAAAGMSRNTVISGRKSAEAVEKPTGRVRAHGGGRPLLIDQDPDLLLDLDDLVEPDARGDPMSPLRWTLKSTRQLAKALGDMGHQVSSWSVAQLLHAMGYSLQATAKTVEGAQHPDRDAQFSYINRLAGERLAAGEPVVSVDCKKKELVNGTKANAGREWQPAGKPTRVDVHDFPDPEIPKAIPYGVYDVGADEGWMSVGDDHDTAAFAVNAIRRWWQTMGAQRYPDATRLLVTADAGGSNSYRNRLYKSNSPSSPRKLAWTSRCATTRPEHPSGTRSNIACSASSRSTGAANPSPRIAPSSNSSLPRRPTPAYGSTPNGTRATTRPASKSPTLNSQRCPSPDTTGTPTGTTTSQPTPPTPLAAKSHAAP